MEKTGSEIVIECLEREGVSVVFGIPGGSVLPLFDKFYSSKIRVVLTRHEQGAAHMADGYARSTGKVGVCVATSGPGATNLVTGLATANMDSVPMVAITGQVRTDVIGSDAFQEADITGITRPVTKHNFLVKDVRELAQTIREAFHIASTGRPGPVLVDVPVDVQKAKTEFVWPEKVDIRSYKPHTKGHPLQIKRAVELIKSAHKPLLYIGGGVISSNSCEDLRKFAEAADIPVVITLMANGAFPFDHPLYVGVLGMHGKYAANMAMQNTDLVIACGARFDDRVTGSVPHFSPISRKIHIDIDPSSISKNVNVDVPLVGDLSQILKELAKHVPTMKHSDWVNQLQDWEAKNPFDYKRDDTLKPQFIIETLHQVTKGDAIVVTGVGQHQMWAMQFYPAKRPRRFLSSGGLGTMGYGFPAALGAKFGNPNEPVICIDGDGSFQMTACELATSALEHCPLVIILINNRSLGMVRQWQEMFFGERFAASCLVRPGGMASKDNLAEVRAASYIPDFVKLAEAQGAIGVRITKKEEFQPALEKALAANEKTVILECMVDPTEKVFPMVPAGAKLDDMIVEDMA